MTRQEELESYSDYEINLHVRKLTSSKALHDYCNNPNDIMPIAIENNISLLLDESDLPEATTNTCWDGGFTDDCISSLDMNIYRAICIVFILMKEGE